MNGHRSFIAEQTGGEGSMAMRWRTAGLIAALMLGKAVDVEAAKLPDGFNETAVVAGINGATAMDFAPDGRLFLCEQTGALRIVKKDVLLPLPFVTVKVDSSWERGLLGVAFDPDFTKNHHLYVNYISPDPYPHHRISRFTADGDRAVPGSEVILFEGDNQEKLGGGVKNGHQGGALHFGKDGKLYVAIGDQTAGAPAQNLKTLQGKLLRINRDGSIPDRQSLLSKDERKISGHLGAWAAQSVHVRLPAGHRPHVHQRRWRGQ